MKKMRFLMPIGVVAMIAAVSAVTMVLWNWLMPAIFGLITITFWQSLGLLLLARILFGGFGRHGRHHWGHRRGEHHTNLEGNPFYNKWRNMSKEEKQEFMKKRHAYMADGMFDDRCHHHGHSDWHSARKEYSEQEIKQEKSSEADNG